MSATSAAGRLSAPLSLASVGSRVSGGAAGLAGLAGIGVLLRCAESGWSTQPW